jgi:glycerol-3-phosphate dehydrogenase
VVEAVNARHENALFLPGIALEPTIKARHDLADLADCDLILAVAPAQHLRARSPPSPRTARPARRSCCAPRASSRAR